MVQPLYFQLPFNNFIQLTLSKSKLALLADSQQTLLDGVPLGFGERAAFGQPVDSLQRGVNQLRIVLCAGKESGTAGQQRQQGRADVPVHCQCSLSGAQHLLWDQKTIHVAEGWRGTEQSPRFQLNIKLE